MKKILLLGILIVGLLLAGCTTGQAVRIKSSPACSGWNMYCGTLLEGETQTYKLAGESYNIKLKGMLYQNYPGGVREATVNVNGQTLTLLEGEEQTLANGKYIKLTEFVYQDYVGGVHSASFCIR